MLKTLHYTATASDYFRVLNYKSALGETWDTVVQAQICALKLCSIVLDGFTPTAVV